MPPISQRRFRWKNGVIVVNLLEDEQIMLAHVLAQLRELVMAERDPALRRLQPPARPDDAAAEAAYREMIDNDLLRSRLEAIEIVEEGIGGTTLDESRITAWLQSLNSLRLVLGERLDLDVVGHAALEDLPDNDERMPIIALYEWLGWLLQQLVDAALNGLDD